MRRLALVTILVTLCLPRALMATTHRLFDVEVQKTRYQVILVEGGYHLLIVDEKTVQMGEQLELDTGETIEFKRVIDAGAHTVVIQDRQGRVIRLPRIVEEDLDFHNVWFHGAYQRLSQRVPREFTAEVGIDEFESNWILTAEFLPIRFLLIDFLNDNFDKESPVYRELLKFFEAFRGVRTLGPEFLPFQVGYIENRGWVLFDYDLKLRVLKPGQFQERLSVLFNHWSEAVDIGELDLNLDNLMELEEDLSDLDFQFLEGQQRSEAPFCAVRMTGTTGF